LGFGERERVYDHLGLLAEGLGMFGGGRGERLGFERWWFEVGEFVGGYFVLLLLLLSLITYITLDHHQLYT
jgi:hypothetical protein